MVGLQPLDWHGCKCKLFSLLKISSKGYVQPLDSRPSTPPREDQALDLTNQPKHKQSFLRLSIITHKLKRDSIENCRLIHTWETWKKSSIHSVCPWGQVRVKVLSPNPQLLRLGQLLAKPRGVVPNKYTKAFKLSTRN
jgi:hypothetical protein